MGKKAKKQFSLEELLSGGKKALAAKAATKPLERSMRQRLLKKIVDNNFKLYEGSLVPDHILATVSVRHCPKCKGECRHTRDIVVVSKSKRGREEITHSLRTNQLFSTWDMILPTKVVESDEYGIVCPECLGVSQQNQSNLFQRLTKLEREKSSLEAKLSLKSSEANDLHDSIELLAAENRAMKKVLLDA